MRLSIIVPVHNMAADNKLRFCLDSLVNQTIADYEIIAVDDASTDESFEILKEYESRYPWKFKAVQSYENRKQGGARNIGLDNCTGDYVLFIDADDALYDSVASATGISNNKITITAYEQPIFKFKEDNREKIADVILIVLLVFVVALLVFIFIKGFKPGSIEAADAELSVEELLAISDSRDDLEDIEHNEKSDSYLKIEEFIDANPEAAAQLLRNWLGEDWRF